MNLRQIFGKRLAPGPELKKTYESLSEAIGGPESLQYAIVDTYLSLRSQAHRDGWMNWSDFYEEGIDLLSAHVPTGAGQDAERIRADLEAIREAGQSGADEGRFGYDELERVATDVVQWCGRNKRLIALSDRADSWFDTQEKRGDNKS
jgi:hypothetical protein